MLNRTRDTLLSEATQSPNLLADLAGLETYIAESYDARSFIELLQNADDAAASRFYAEQFGKYLIVANDGKLFTDADFESLCRSSSSAKRRGESIGYRGIGFKSVVGVASRVHLISGNLSVTFCREKTKIEIPTATKVPLVRIPHDLDLGDNSIVESKIDWLLESEFTTLFIFEGLNSHAVKTEFESFSAATLLFLRNIREANLIGAKSQKIKTSLIEEATDHRRISIDTRGSTQEWMIHERAGTSIAALIKGNRAERLPHDDAVVHAFLPTHERSGLGVKINGDFSTDPSRTKVVLDVRSEKCTKYVAGFLLDLIDGCIGRNEFNLLTPFIPNEDIRMTEFELPSFKKSLFNEFLKQGKMRFSDISLRPKWFDSFQDFQDVACASGLKSLDPGFEKVDGLPAFLKALGAKEVHIKELGDGLQTSALSVAGAIQVAARVAELESTKQLDVDFSDWRIWPVNGKVVSADELKRQPVELENTTLLAEKLGGEKVLGNFLDRLLGKKVSETVFKYRYDQSNRETEGSNSSKRFIDERLSGQGLKDQIEQINNRSVDCARTVSKWRSAEIQVMDYLRTQGWKVTDVSKRNVGYDLEAISTSGETIYFETKSISKVGDTFSLTTNEEVVARQHGNKYVLALTHITDAYLEIDFIPDPANNLPFIRICKQWAWVCETYPFNPLRIGYRND
ncbi:DUF3883 domain-containing protein [Mariniblastus sp.]|nr:DUF3883 domain-containing protein [Mariniblastus sp.]